MSILTKHFGTDRKIFLPVVHATSPKQLRAQLMLANLLGADGAMCISHNEEHLDAITLIGTISLCIAMGDIPHEFKVGVNLLGRPAHKVVTAIDAFGGERCGISMLWSDEPPEDAAAMQRARETHDWHDGLYLAGCAFKYQRKVAPAFWAPAAMECAADCDIVCTSGDQTGEAADTRKLRVMRAALGLLTKRTPLAVASGVSLDNVDEQARAGVDVFLVASSIERSFGDFDPARLQALAERIHSYRRHCDSDGAGPA